MENGEDGKTTTNLLGFDFDRPLAQSKTLATAAKSVMLEAVSAALQSRCERLNGGNMPSAIGIAISVPIQLMLLVGLSAAFSAICSRVATGKGGRRRCCLRACRRNVCSGC